jgi:hypothetical protein
MQFDPDDQEDMLKTDIDPVTGEGGDDAVDCLMYLLMGQRYIGEFKQPANEPQEGSPAWYRRRQHSPRPAGGEP